MPAAAHGRDLGKTRFGRPHVAASAEARVNYLQVRSQHMNKSVGASDRASAPLGKAVAQPRLKESFSVDAE